ncbi:MAG: hypothetical protein HY362_02885 [Candidatus Aenigmarchaeota archaeon]|nr:hypothetical protein [Candidatus Aenigmarchaeota archaeon]
MAAEIFGIPIETLPAALLFFIALFLLYRLFKLALRAGIAAAAGFGFLYIAPLIFAKLGIVFPLPPPTIENSIQFAGYALGLFLLYEFAHVAIFVLKIVTWPFRALLKTSRKDELAQMKKELLEEESKRKENR